MFGICLSPISRFQGSGVSVSPIFLSRAFLSNGVLLYTADLKLAVFVSFSSFCSPTGSSDRIQEIGIDIFRVGHAPNHTKRYAIMTGFVFSVPHLRFKKIVLG